jgi:hypothetical protein
MNTLKGVKDYGGDSVVQGEKIKGLRNGLEDQSISGGVKYINPEGK